MCSYHCLSGRIRALHWWCRVILARIVLVGSRGAGILTDVPHDLILLVILQLIACRKRALCDKTQWPYYCQEGKGRVAGMLHCARLMFLTSKYADPRILINYFAIQTLSATERENQPTPVTPLSKEGPRSPTLPANMENRSFTRYYLCRCCKLANCCCH